MQKKHILTLLLLLVISIVKAQPPARILFNSSFESPVIPDTTFRFIDESLVAGWDVDSGTEIEFWASGFNGVISQDGNQHIELNARRPSDVFLDICLLETETVTLAFHHRARGGRNRTNTVEIEALNQISGNIEISNITATNVDDTDGNSWVGVGTIVVPAAPTNNFQATSPTTGWTKYELDLTNEGASGTCRVIFRGIGDGSTGNFIDNVQITGLNPLTEFSADSYSDDEGNGGNLPMILINGRVETASSVDILIQNGTATQPDDYTNRGTITVNIPVGDYDGTEDTGISIPLGIINDNDIEPNEDIIISYVMGSETGTISIADADCNITEVLNTEYIIIDDDDLLPVTFTEWRLDDTECGKVELSWITSQELNSNYFEVQFSEEGINWISIAKLIAKGTVNYSNDYSFIHHTDYKSGYYRLNQVDFNGHSTLTHVISSTQNCEKESNYFKFYPNPKSSNQSLNLEFYSTSTSLDYTIIDALGRQIKTSTIAVNSNQFIKQEIKDNLSNGLYLIKFLQNGKEIYQTRLIIK